MAKKKQKKSKVTKGERLLYTSACFCFVIMLGLKIFCGASIGETKMSIEETKYKIDTQEKTNESLTMKVNELTSFENVKKVVEEMGLAYNNDNIIVIDSGRGSKWNKNRTSKIGNFQEMSFLFFCLP